MQIFFIFSISNANYKCIDIFKNILIHYPSLWAAASFSSRVTALFVVGGGFVGDSWCIGGVGMTVSVADWIRSFWVGTSTSTCSFDATTAGLGVSVGGAASCSLTCGVGFTLAEDVSPLGLAAVTFSGVPLICPENLKK